MTNLLFFRRCAVASREREGEGSLGPRRVSRADAAYTSIRVQYHQKHYAIYSYVRVLIPEPRIDRYVPYEDPVSAIPVFARDICMKVAVGPIASQKDRQDFVSLLLAGCKALRLAFCLFVFL